MKKKILLTICALFVTCSVMIGMLKPVNVNAVTAKVPDAIPDANDVLYAILDGPFNYGDYIKFDGVAAKQEMKKIILTANPGTEDSPLGESWFTVYCLDGSLKFPEFSIVNAGEIAENKYGVQTLLMMALFNNKDLYNVFEKAEGYKIGPEIEYALPDGYTDASLVQAVKAGTQVTVNVSKLTYTKSMTDTSTVEITAEELSKTQGQTVYPVTIKKDEVMFDKYTSEVMSNENYSHALWILEHSYPTFDLKTSLEMAGADIDYAIAETRALLSLNGSKTVQEVANELKTLKACTAKDEIATMIGVTVDEVTPEKCSEKYNSLLEESKVEDFVYSTVQYAVWKANGGVDSNGNAIGSNLTSVQAGAEANTNQLNKLYQYLIQNRDEYNGYLNFQFDNTLKLNAPQSGKEIFKDTDKHFVYGPYTVGYDMLSIKDVTVSLEGTPAGVEIVDEAGNALTTLTPNQKFYIKAEKDKKITNIKVKLKTENAITFNPKENRGRIYYSYYPLAQNVVSGGKYNTVDVEKTIEIVFNPKTGDSNTAILFVLTLVGFSLGYVALIMKNKIIELN